MSADDPYAQLRDYYSEFVDHKTPARKVAWRSHDDQTLRLEVLLEAVGDSDYPCSILDVGCGVGALYGLLERTERLGAYCGIDLLPSMIEAARAAYPKGRFERGDLLENRDDGLYDLVVCSGALNVRVPKHGSWVRRMLSAMWQRARWALAVNFQTTRAYEFNPLSRHDEDLFHGDRATLLAWCEKLTPWVAMRQDYLGDDISFYLYKDYHRSCRRLEREPRCDTRSELDRLCGMAFLLLERKLPNEALRVLEDAPVSAKVLNYRGLCYHRMKDYDRARSLYKAALERDPFLEEAKLNLDWIASRWYSDESSGK